jgi:hypothetical protein
LFSILPALAAAPGGSAALSQKHDYPFADPGNSATSRNETDNSSNMKCGRMKQTER